MPGSTVRTRAAMRDRDRPLTPRGAATLRSCARKEVQPIGYRKARRIRSRLLTFLARGNLRRATVERRSSSAHPQWYFVHEVPLRRRGAPPAALGTHRKRCFLNEVQLRRRGAPPGALGTHRKLCFLHEVQLRRRGAPPEALGTRRPLPARNLPKDPRCARPSVQSVVGAGSPSGVTKHERPEVSSLRGAVSLAIGVGPTYAQPLPWPASRGRP